MRRGWILLLIAAGTGAQEFSEALLDRAIGEVRLRKVEWVRAVAAWGPRAERAVPALLEVSWIPSAEFQDALKAAIRAIGPAAVPALAKGARRGEPEAARWAAARLLEFAEHPPAVALPAGREGQLLDLLDEEDPVVRQAAARGLATEGAAIAPRLVALLGDASARRRHCAALALGFMEPPPEDALPALLEAARDRNASVREAAVIAVGRIRSSPDERVRCLFAALADPATGVVAAAVEGIARRGSDAVAPLIAAWDSGDPVARHATEGLVRLGDPAVGAVTEALRSGTAARKREAARCLGRMAARRDLPVEPALVAALKDGDADVRLAAAEALGIASPQVAARAIDALLLATQDADPRVRAASVAAAVRVAPSDPRVADAVERAKADADPGVKLAVAAASAASPGQWAAILRAPAAPRAARLVAAEEVRTLQAPCGALLEPLARVVSDAGQPPDIRAAAAHAIGAIGARRIYEARFGPRVDPPMRAARAAAERALRWLAAAQREDGRWACDGFDRDNHDVGVTGLALLAFLAAGETDRGPAPHAKQVRDGFAWLLSRQTPEGLFREGAGHTHTLLEHAIATHALAELIGMTGDDALREAARRAVDHCVATRGGQGWRYTPKSAESDTNVTTFMVTALRIADEGGFAVDPACYMGAAQWVRKMTDPTFGQVGYRLPGGAPSRPEGREDRFPAERSQSMTAAGLHCRILMGEDPKGVEEMRKGVELCVETLPVWDPEAGAVDMYYWYYGALALFHVGGKHWTRWNDAMLGAIVKHQQPGEPPAGGSWAPVCVWGDSGGSVYSTAICALALLTPWRYPRGWSLETKPPTVWAAASAALSDAAGSPYGSLRDAARQALARCPGRR